MNTHYHPYDAGDRFPEPKPSIKSTTAEFVRPGDCRQIFGLSRAYIYVLLAEGKIRSVSLRRRGNLRGVRLIDTQSVRNYLNNIG